MSNQKEFETEFTDLQNLDVKILKGLILMLFLVILVMAVACRQLAVNVERLEKRLDEVEAKTGYLWIKSERKD